MKFEDLLYLYEKELEYVDRMTQPDNLSFYKKTKEYYDGYRKACNKWFESLKEKCEDFIPMIKFCISEEKYNNCLLIGHLEYRGESVPVYDDDYGQQMFIVYQDQIISGGPFNPCPEDDFCYAIDQIKDKIY